ncbi:MAG: hypothetical protein ACYTEG_10415, partial [Planctomycetota bacterium]
MRRKLLIVMLALPLVALLGLVLYAKLGDHRRTIERLANRALDGRLSVAGRFETDVGLTTRVFAENVSLAAPDWSDAPATVHVDRLEGSVDLWSFVRGPVLVRDLEVHGARVVVEEDERGRSSFFFGSEPRERSASPAPPGPPDIGVIFEQAELRNVVVSYRDAARTDALEIVVDELGLHVDMARVVDLNASGRIDDIPVEVAGRVRTFDSLVSGGAIDSELNGRVGDVDFKLSGRFDELARLAAPEFDLELSGADVAASARTLGLPAVTPGAYRVEGHLRPADDDRVGVSLELEMRNLRAQVQGTLHSLLDPQPFTLEVSATSPDSTGVEALAGLEGFPHDELSVSGTVIRDADGTRLREVRAALGGNRLNADGLLGSWPRMLGTDFTFDAEGPDLSVLSAVAGVDFPPATYSAVGRIVRREAGVAIEELKARLGEAEVTLSGVIGDWPTFDGTHLDLDLRCPDASVFRTLTGIELPSSPVELEGRIRPGAGTLVLEGVDALLGSDTAHLDGTIVRTNGFVGTDLRVRLFGPDLTDVATLLGLERLPQEPFDLAGHVRVLEEGYALDDVELRYGEANLSVDGKLGDVPDLSGTDLRVHIVGPDVSRLAALGEIEGWPDDPFEASGDVRVVERGYELESVEARVGEIELEVGGLIASDPELVGTALDIDGRGPDLSALAGYVGVDALPSAPFAVRGRYEILQAGHRLREVAGRVGDHDLEVDGTLVLAEGLEGTEFVARVSGPAVDDAARLLVDAGVVGPTSVPSAAYPYEVSGDVRVEAGDRTSWRRLDVRIGKARLHAAGVLGSLPQGEGSDFSVEAEGPNGANVGAVFGVELPPEPFSIRGRVVRQSSGAHFDDVRIRLGDYRAEIAGTLGEPPKLVGTKLDLHVEGPDLALLAPYLDLPFMDAAYEISAHFDGTPDRFSLTDFSADLGNSDLRGEVHVDLRGKPSVHGELASDRFDVAVLQEPEALPDTADPDFDSTAEAVPASKGDYYISDESLTLEWLDSFDADVDWRIDVLKTRFISLLETHLEADLVDGHLAIGPVRGDGENGGSIVASITLEPFEDVYRATATLTAEQLRLALSESAIEREQYAPHDALVQLQGHGRSLHEMAATIEGHLVVIQGAGAINLEILGPLTRDALMKIASSMRITSPEESERLECGVHLYKFKDGRVTLDPFALVTTRVKIIGRGKLDLETEKIDVAWAAKPRKGIGLSASAVTNPYVKLGGTLSSPSMSV